MIPSLPAKPISVARPHLPSTETILPYLRQIDENAWYSNHGPLARRFQGRLAAHWDVAEPNVALLSSATSALTLALQASGVEPGLRCLMPSWTFVATAGAVAAAGLIPHFVDVNPETWTPDPAELEHLAQRYNVGAIVVVAPFGTPLVMSDWDGLRRRSGLPVIIDAAASFDTLRAGGPMQVGECPIVVSLHATKVFGIGEGGAMISRDSEFLGRVRATAQFGFAGSREAKWRGSNAKLSEYGAAVGLAGLDLWKDIRARWERVTGAYQAVLPQQIGLPPRFDYHFVSSTLTILWPEHRPDLDEVLLASGIGTMRWWGAGCHAHCAYKACPRESLPNTIDLARRAIGLPFWQDLSHSQIATVGATLRRLLPCRHAPVRAQRIRGGALAEV